MNQLENSPLFGLAIFFGAQMAYYWLQALRGKREIFRFQLQRVAIYITCVMVGVGILPSYGYNVRDAAIFSLFVGMTAALILIQPPCNDRRGAAQG